MDLELSDQQQWITEAVDTLLARDDGRGHLWAGWSSSARCPSAARTGWERSSFA